MSQNFQSTFTVTVHFNRQRRKSLVLAFRAREQSTRFFIELEDQLAKLVEDARKKHSSVLVPTSIRPDKILPEGLKVRFRTGEAYGEKIEWDEPEGGALVYKHDINPNGECGIMIREVGRHGYAGFDDQSQTYWRYLEEARGDIYREHCLQILEVL